ncbi:hypothetical protein DPMN_007663 [Dreissena polymorpha]|uniref:Uncharacterized protein n=1 Tax=Dreissena polymorpha TaxID=45954 RepID=A0A9D4MU01_DREPO|nr:hypothetical protein DPMN_056681 [Dreissena polymorpha]KAH3772646.1 hypothetical protein DPMN_173988 [Dreissena polymorpha]KAH3805097.1 hypothetical protein DPMN_133393 [Dreissena polymorpha]KAH3881669.1 hypothetical protein DPMN_005596 [Dreissena polymorpha]KAH3883698.1 hypothetical protein DPMN_007663 [Dreissena polymorpha]
MLKQDMHCGFHQQSNHSTSFMKFIGNDLQLMTRFWKSEVPGTAPSLLTRLYMLK